MIARISSAAVPAAVAVVSLLAAAPATAAAQTDEREIIDVVTRFLDGIRTRDTTLMRATVAAGATLVPVASPAGLGAPSTLDAVIERAGKGAGPGNDERIAAPTVQIDDPLAVLWAPFTLTRPGDTSVDVCGTNVFMLQKTPNGWKIFQIVATSRTQGCKPFPTQPNGCVR